MPIEILLMIVAFLTIFVVIHPKWMTKIWNEYMYPVDGDKHWHAWLFLGGVIVLLALQTTLNLWFWVVPAIATGFAIGKEIWDWWHGRYFDFMDLLADAIGTGLAYIIFYGVRLI